MKISEQKFFPGKPASEFVEILSLAIANSYGSPLIGYPGTNDNKTSEQMMGGVISILPDKSDNPRPFILIKVRINNIFVKGFLSYL